MKNLTYRIIIEPDEGGTYHAYVPALRGCHTWGESVEEAQKNIKEALDLYVTSLVVDGEEVPEDRGMELFETVSLNGRNLVFV